MKPASFKFIAAACLGLALGIVWCAPAPEQPSSASVAALEAAVPVLKATASSVPAASPSAKSTTSDAVRSTQATERINAASAAYSEHAPLALFSLGSLAVGGVFYGISTTMHRSNVSYTAGGRTQLTAAVGIAGLTAVLAAGSYFYYVHHASDHDGEKTRDWDAQVTGGVAPDGDASIGALVTLPLPSLSR